MAWQQQNRTGADFAPDIMETDLAADARDRLRDLIARLPDTPSRLRVMGHVLLDLALPDLALEAFGRALLMDDLDIATHLGLARTYVQKGARGAATDHLRIAITLDPQSRDLRIVLADLLRGDRKMTGALDQLGAVLVADPAHAGARKGLAHLIRMAVAGRTRAQDNLPALQDIGHVWLGPEPDFRAMQ
ncbi:lipopolysaccharide assembly protein LapB [Thalassospira sp.]|uniref:tetratricopeptide repeat protein n=1 Tax=Thalassospira sp. TaxID=1912094 RepID=UPI002733D5FD|nr:hypothetical protein [Thalassospira sp.]MDP2697491.1 hypothetical protein [Thalassospira sp.]